MGHNNKEQMNIVVVGHVDHGKSTLLGRLFADTKSLPEGKLEQVKEQCKRNSKEFEYAFLLDALKDEQSQGITIDSARAFFKTQKRDYIIIDAPGHIEFLKNMISGAARAQAAILLIDAKEGIQENSKRHAYMLSMLGIKQIVVAVNKMDLINYNKETYEQIKKDYTNYLKKINIEPKEFIAISARDGDNIATKSKHMNWSNKTILESLDEFEKEKDPENKPLRMIVQDVYKFTNKGDDRRIIAGFVNQGTAKPGERVVFLPSNKHSTINTIEEFNSNQKELIPNRSTAVTLTEQIYVKRGDIMCLENNIPKITSSFKANIFWMGKEPIKQNNEYKLKLGTQNVKVKIKEIVNVLDSSNLDNKNNQEIKKNDVGECILEAVKPIAYDLYQESKATGRFVLVDGYEISGGGIITQEINDEESEIINQVLEREKKWDHNITPQKRAEKFGQKPVTILITGDKEIDKKTPAKNLEKLLFQRGRNPYFLGIGNILRGLDSDINTKSNEHIRRLGEVANILMDAGLIVIATASNLEEKELKQLQIILGNENLITIVSNNNFTTFEPDLTKIDEYEILELLKKKNIIFMN